MVFAHDSEMALQAAVDLVNSDDDGALWTLEGLEEFLDQRQYTGRRDRSEAELRSVRALPPRLRGVLLAERDAAVEIVNAMLSEATLSPHLARHDDYDWHLHAIDQEAPLAERIMVETAMAMVDVIRADEHSRLGVCADEGCDDVVLDLSRNRSRRYCSTGCANRNAVAAYRARQAD